MAVVAAVAEREGKDPLDVDQPLSDVIDPDALDSLFPRSVDAEGVPIGRVEFSYYGYDIEVTSAGEVRITERA